MTKMEPCGGRETGLQKASSLEYVFLFEVGAPYVTEFEKLEDWLNLSCSLEKKKIKKILIIIRNMSLVNGLVRVVSQHGFKLLLWTYFSLFHVRKAAESFHIFFLV